MFMILSALLIHIMGSQTDLFLFKFSEKDSIWIFWVIIFIFKILSADKKLSRQETDDMLNILKFLTL